MFASTWRIRIEVPNIGNLRNAVFTPAQSAALLVPFPAAQPVARDDGISTFGAAAENNERFFQFIRLFIERRKDWKCFANPPNSEIGLGVVKHLRGCEWASLEDEV